MDRRSFFKAVGGAVAAVLWPWKAEAQDAMDEPVSIYATVSGFGVTSAEQWRRYAIWQAGPEQVGMFCPAWTLDGAALLACAPGDKVRLCSPVDGKYHWYVIQEMTFLSQDEGGGVWVACDEIPDERHKQQDDLERRIVDVIREDQQTNGPLRGGQQ